MFSNEPLMVVLAALACGLGGMCMCLLSRRLSCNDTESSTALLKARSDSSIDLMQRADTLRYTELEEQLRVNAEAALVQSEAAARAVAAQQALAAAAGAEVAKLRVFADANAAALELARHEAETSAAEVVRLRSELAQLQTGNDGNAVADRLEHGTAEESRGAMQTRSDGHDGV